MVRTGKILSIYLNFGLLGPIAMKRFENEIKFWCISKNPRLCQGGWFYEVHLTKRKQNFKHTWSQKRIKSTQKNKSI